MRSLLVFVAFFVAAASPGCRCSSSAPAEPEAAPPPSSTRHRESCVEPAWATPVDDVDHLLAEVIYQPAASTGRNGNGMRIYESGRVVSYEDVKVGLDGGRIVTENIPGAWRELGPASADRMNDLRAAIAHVAADQLVDFQGRHIATQQRPTLVFVRKDGKLLRSCHLGQEASSAQDQIEEIVRRTIGETAEAAAAKDGGSK